MSARDLTVVHHGNEKAMRKMFAVLGLLFVAADSEDLGSGVATAQQLAD